MSDPFTLEREQWVPRSLQEVFAFFSEAGNLDRLTPAWLHFQILTPQPIEIKQGTIIDYRLRWHGVPLLWKTEIMRWQPPHHFQDLQIRGPYQLWRHTHIFEAADQGTRIRDHVEYALPFGLLGRAMHAVSVRRNVEEIFAYRDKKVGDLFSHP